jgi:hypothetical protein
MNRIIKWIRSLFKRETVVSIDHRVDRYDFGLFGEWLKDTKHNSAKLGFINSHKYISIISPVVAFQSPYHGDVPKRVITKDIEIESNMSKEDLCMAYGENYVPDKVDAFGDYHYPAKNEL